MLRAFFDLAIVLAREAELDQFFAHRIGADWMSHAGQLRRQFGHALRDPQQRAHRITKCGGLDEALQGGCEIGVVCAHGLATGAGTANLPLRQVFTVEIILASIDRRAGKAGDPRDHRKPTPTGGPDLTSREHSPPALVEFRADGFPAHADGVLIYHAIRTTTVRTAQESRHPGSCSRTHTDRDSLIVRGVLTPKNAFHLPKD